MTNSERQKLQTESTIASIDRWLGMSSNKGLQDPREKVKIRNFCEKILRILPDAEYPTEIATPVDSDSLVDLRPRTILRKQYSKNQNNLPATAIVSGATVKETAPQRLHIIKTEILSGTELQVDIALRELGRQYWVNVTLVQKSKKPIPDVISGCTFRIQFQNKYDIQSSVDLVVYQSQPGIITSKESMLPKIAVDSDQEIWCTGLEIKTAAPAVQASIDIQPSTLPSGRPQFTLRTSGSSNYAFPAVLPVEKPTPLPSLAADDEQRKLIAQMPTGGICQGFLKLHPSNELCQAYRDHGYVNEKVFQQLIRWLQLKLGWQGFATLRSCNCWSAPDHPTCDDCEAPDNELPPRISGDSFMLSVTMSTLDALCGHGHGLPKGMIATGGFRIGDRYQDIEVAHLADKIEQCMGISANNRQRPQESPCRHADTTGELSTRWLRPGETKLLLTGINTDWFDHLDALGLEATEVSMPATELRRQLASGELTDQADGEFVVVMVRDLAQALFVVSDALGLDKRVLEALHPSALYATESKTITCYRLHVRRSNRKRHDDIRRSISWMFNEIYERKGRHSGGLSQCCDILRNYIEHENNLSCLGCQIGYFSISDQMVKVIGQSTESGHKFPAEYMFNKGLFGRVFHQRRLAIFSYGEGMVAPAEHLGVVEKSLEATPGFPLEQGLSVHLPIFARSGEIVGVCNLFIDQPLKDELLRESIHQTVNLLAGEINNFRLAHQAPRPLIEAEERSSYFDLDPLGRLKGLSQHACQEAMHLPDVYRVILRLYNQDNGVLQYAASGGKFDQLFKHADILERDARYAVTEALRDRTAVFINCVETYEGSFQPIGPQSPESHASICIFDDQHVVGVLSVDFCQPHALTDWVQEKLVHLGESIGKEFGQIQESISLQSLVRIESNAFRQLNHFNDSKYWSTFDVGKSAFIDAWELGEPDPAFQITLPPNCESLATSRKQFDDKLNYFDFCKVAHTNLYSSQSALYLINPETGMLEIKALVNQYDPKNAVDKIPRSYGINDKWYDGLIGWTLRLAERQSANLKNAKAIEDADDFEDIPSPVLNLKNCFDLKELEDYRRPHLGIRAPEWKNMPAFRDIFIPLFKNPSRCESMALLCVPIRAFGELFGVLRFSYADDRRDEFFSNFDVLKAQNVAARLANYLHYVESKFLNNVLQDFEADICQVVATPRVDSSFESQCLHATKVAIRKALGPQAKVGMLLSTLTYRNLASSAPKANDKNTPFWSKRNPK